MMRIISGSARGTKLVTLEGDATRPTLERVKEAMFSMIQFEIAEKEVLDLFSGSGQLALEALSRGARCADLVDSSSNAGKVILQNIAKTHSENKATYHRCSAEEFLTRNRGKRRYSLVFLDPPYAKGLIPGVLEKLSSGEMLEKGATVVCECDSKDTAEDVLPKNSRFTVRREAVYSGTRLLILNYVSEAEE